jgi:hypothetical protein
LVPYEFGIRPSQGSKHALLFRLLLMLQPA